MPSALSLSILEHCISFLFFLVLMIGPWGAITTVWATHHEPWDLMSTGTALQLPSLFLYYGTTSVLWEGLEFCFALLLFPVWHRSMIHLPQPHNIYTMFQVFHSCKLDFWCWKWCFITLHSDVGFPLCCVHHCSEISCSAGRGEAIDSLSAVGWTLKSLTWHKMVHLSIHHKMSPHWG